jgi:peptide/nickel transport system ATP-binding protein/oligopeptide transport system ATP-binding protein
MAHLPGWKRDPRCELVAVCDVSQEAADEAARKYEIPTVTGTYGVLLELQRDFGMSMILVSHDLGVIAEMCDRIAVMYGGQIVELADAGTLLTEPRHPYTISLLRSLPDADRKTKYLQSIPGTPPRLVDIEAGCRFATRCPLATPECRAWETELLAAAGGAHLVRCRRHDDARRPEAWPTQSYESE